MISLTQADYAADGARGNRVLLAAGEPRSRSPPEEHMTLGRGRR
jgi:hypothetical protein